MSSIDDELELHEILRARRLPWSGRREGRPTHEVKPIPLMLPPPPLVDRYVLDEFCGEVCFECRCPSVHQKKMTALAGFLSLLETMSQTSLLLPCLLLSTLGAVSLVFADAVMPCFECRDFRAVAVHEVGHLLSLEHPTGATGSIPLLRGAAPPPPPPPMNATTGEFLFYNATEQHLLREARVRAGGEYNLTYRSMYEPAACADPFYGVEVDGAVPALLSPPPSPPPPPWAPGTTRPPPPPLPPALPPNTTARPPPGNDTSFEDKMGSTLSLSDSVRRPSGLRGVEGPGCGGADVRHLSHESQVMIAFGSLGIERPVAGAARRCLAQVHSSHSLEEHLEEPLENPPDGSFPHDIRLGAASRRTTSTGSTSSTRAVASSCARRRARSCRSSPSSRCASSSSSSS